MITIENEMLRVDINAAGAELNSLFNKVTGLEYLWSGDPAFWNKKSPVLFPIIGALKNNSYSFNNKIYELGRHGFAREKLFVLAAQTSSAVTFELQNDAGTLSVYPFQFSLAITYTIEKASLSVTYSVKNKGIENMYFSVGGHPAFKLPLVKELAYEDYYIAFNKAEHTGRWPINKEGLVETTPLPLLHNTDQLALSKSLFYTDAIVLKNLRSNEVQVRSDKHPAGFGFSFKGFPYLGIWAAKDADFVCIEPWCGISDSVDTNQVLREKEGIVNLSAGEDFERSWVATTW